MTGAVFSRLDVNYTRDDKYTGRERPGSTDKGLVAQTTKVFVARERTWLQPLHNT